MLSQGKRIGWVDGDWLYLEPEAAQAEAKKLAEEQGQPLLVTSRMLWKLLYEAGHLAEVDSGGPSLRYTVRKHVEGRRQPVIVFPTRALLGIDSPGDRGIPL